MTLPGRRLFIGFSFALAAAFSTAATLAPVSQAHAQGLFSQPKYAAIVVDANTGEVLYQKRADAIRYPASLTKMMTLYLTFEALATGRLSLHDQVLISRHAANQAPSKSRLRAGESLSVDQAIRLTAVHSANDIAVALAEKISGSEERFAQLMTLRAQELGMSHTAYVDANGLPNPRQVTTARDMAILARAIMRDYPQYYSYFGQRNLEFDGQDYVNHNHLLAKLPGVDGIKTGYTAAAGFNLAASAVRDGHRLITIVLGGPSTAARDENVEELLNAGFTVLRKRALGQNITVAQLADPEDMSGPIERAPMEMGDGDQDNLKVEVQSDLKTAPMQTVAPKRVAEAETAVPCRPARHHGRRHRAEACASTVAKAKVKASRNDDEKLAAAPCPKSRRHHRRHAACEGKAAQVAQSGYMIQVGAFSSRSMAKAHLEKVSDRFGHVMGGASGQVEKSGRSYGARFHGFSRAQAHAACRALSRKGERCAVMSDS